MRPRMTARRVWLLMAEGCNAAEIAAYAGIRQSVALAMMANAARKHAGVKPKTLLSRAA